jgi:hypothetical protein
MVKLYNFLASWQLFPEKGTYANNNRPKSGMYKIESDIITNTIKIQHHWVTLENSAFAAEFQCNADGTASSYIDETIADSIQLNCIDGSHFEILFNKSSTTTLKVFHEIMPNGFLKITQQEITDNVVTPTNVEVFHKQMSVLPYGSSVSGAVIKPTEEGVIRHKSLSAMEEQTNMQFAQIRRQIELLALQAQEIQKRKELSMMIYNAKLNFQPVIGQVYFLYEKKDDNLMISMVSPKEWGNGSGPFKRFIAAVKLLADHTWMEIAE